MMSDYKQCIKLVSIVLITHIKLGYTKETYDKMQNIKYSVIKSTDIKNRKLPDFNKREFILPETKMIAPNGRMK